MKVGKINGIDVECEEETWKRFKEFCANNSNWKNILTHAFDIVYMQAAKSEMEKAKND